jgi:hypothetical protein
MSYRNPRQFIDTSTAKHFERLQQNISGSFASFAKVYGDSYAKAIKEERERIKANEVAISKRNAKIEDAANKIRLDGAKVKANNPAISFQDLNTEVDLFSNLQTGLDSNLITDPKERSKANQRIISIKALPEQFRGGLENLISVGQDFSEKRSLMDQPGGFYGGANSRLFDDFGVISNQLKGSVKTQYKYLEDTNVYETGFVITPEGKEPQYYSDARLKEIVDSRDGSMVTIPDETKDFITMRDSVRGYNEDSEVKEFPKELLIGEEYQEVIDGELITFKNVNAKAAEKKVNAQLNANVDGDAFTDWERVAFFNTQIDPNNPLIHPDSTNFNRDINNQRFSEGYKEYFMENFVPKRIALNRRRLSQKELDARAGFDDSKTSAPKERASTVVNLLSESPEQAIATYLGEIQYTRDGSKITITRDKGEETWDLTIPSQFENLATELHKKKYGDDDKTLDAIRDILKTKDFDAILKPPFVGPSNKPVLPVKK